MNRIDFFGATGGIGSELTPFLLDKGYNVYPISSSEVNLLDEESIKRYFQQNPNPEVILIFNAYNFDKFLHSYAKQNDFTELQKQIEVNVLGISKLLSTVVHCMRSKQQGGRIIVATSVTTTNPIPGTGIYSSSKAYLEQLVKTIAIENATHDITANCIRLGYIDAGLTEKIDRTFLEHYILPNIPAKRLGSVKDIAEVVSLIINTPYMNGTAVELTGGL